MNRSTKIKIVITALLVSSAVLFSRNANSFAQNGKPPPLPLPEMKKLSKLYVGTWTYTEIYPKSPMFPNGGENTGVYTSELGPGGNSIINHFHSKGPVGEFDGVLIMTFDPQENAYKAYVFGDSFPSALVETGHWGSEVLVYRTELSMGLMKVALRNETKFLDGGMLTRDEFSNVNGSPEKLFVHVEATKK